jgi:hypothetical protein
MNITKCSSTHCIYRNKCFRGIVTKEDEDDPDLCFVNFEIMGCCEYSFDMFIPILNDERKN